MSAILTWDFLEVVEHWTVADLFLVNYQMRDAWLSTNLPPSAAVVDFLYHPKARFWADHHQTTFLTVEAKVDFQRRRNPWLVYNDSVGSCAALLWRHLQKQFVYRNQRYEALVKWADKIDAARYDSVEEAVFCDTPALAIRLSLGLGNSKSYIKDLVRILRDEPLESVVEIPRIKRRIQKAQRLSRAGLKRLQEGCRVVNDDIVVFDVDTTGVLVNRYAPYYFYPRARYSVGILRSAEGAKITAMRNPWSDFPSLPLGKIFEKLGGGGHQRVGSLLLSNSNAAKASGILKQLITEIHNRDLSPVESPAL